MTSPQDPYPSSGGPQPPQFSPHGGPPPGTAAGYGQSGWAPAGFGLNQPVRDKISEFTVKSLKCGIAKVGSDPLVSTATGQYCLATVGVKNISSEAQELSSSEDTAYNAAGTKYVSDVEATVHANDEELFFKKINPGVSVDLIVVWDIPKDQTIAKVRLFDGSLDDYKGVLVAVT